jgi:hypothetical protein
MYHRKHIFPYAMAFFYYLCSCINLYHSASYLFVWSNELIFIYTVIQKASESILHWTTHVVCTLIRPRKVNKRRISCEVGSCNHRPGHRKPSQLAAFQGAEWSKPRRFRCSHIWTKMLDNIGEHLSFTFLLVSYSCEALLQCLIYLVLIVTIFDRLINHKNRSMTSACIHHSPEQYSI